MGGLGSGRPYHLCARATTAEYLALDVRRIQREGLLTPGTVGVHTWRRRSGVSRIGFRVEGDEGERAEGLLLAYIVNGEAVTLPVRLSWTACNFGGARPWLLCPACGRRVAIPYGGCHYACRTCHGLAYPSSRQSRADRKLSNTQRLRESLGGSANMGLPFPDKPKGMHWRT